MKPEEVLDAALAGHPRAEELKRAMLSATYVQALQDEIEARPAERQRRDLIVEYAERHGGTILEFLQMFDGAYWGTGVELSLEQCSKVLGVPAKDLERLYDKMLAELQPQLVPTGRPAVGEPPGRVARVVSLIDRRAPNGTSGVAGHRTRLHQGNGRSRRRKAK